MASIKAISRANSRKLLIRKVKIISIWSYKIRDPQNDPGSSGAKKIWYQGWLAKRKRERRVRRLTLRIFQSVKEGRAA